MTLHMRVALKTQYLFVVGAKPFPANQMLNPSVTIVFFRYSIFLPILYMEQQDFEPKSHNTDETRFFKNHQVPLKPHTN